MFPYSKEYLVTAYLDNNQKTLFTTYTFIRTYTVIRQVRVSTYDRDECEDIVLLIPNYVRREFLPIFSSNPYSSGGIFFGTTTPSPESRTTSEKSMSAVVIR